MIIQQLTDGSVDMGIICGDYPFLGEKVCLFEEELYIVAPKEATLDRDIGIRNFMCFVRKATKVSAPPLIDHEFYDRIKVGFDEFLIPLPESTCRIFSENM